MVGMGAYKDCAKKPTVEAYRDRPPTVFAFYFFSKNWFIFAIFSKNNTKSNRHRNIHITMKCATCGYEGDKWGIVGAIFYAEDNTLSYRFQCPRCDGDDLYVKLATEGDETPV